MLRLLWLVLMLGLAAPAAANGEAVSLRESLCAVSGDVARPAVGGPDCARKIPPHEGWTWYLHREPRALADLPSDWELLFSVTRFERVKLVVEHRNGATVIERDASELRRDLAYGNHFRIVVPLAGRDITGLRLGFENIRDPRLFRSVRAMSSPAHERYADLWHIVLSITVTVVGTSLVYNLFLYAGMGRGIRQWYAAWALFALGYMLAWSGAAFHLVPALASEWAKRADLALIGATVACGTMFFFGFIEAGKLPRRLVSTGRWLALLVFVSGLLAAADPWLPAHITDRLLNLAFLASTGSIMVGIGYAIAARSRVVWFYLAGWSPPIAVLMLRIARNFGLAERSDLVDLAGFVAIAFEAVVLSLAIGDRLRNLRRELDSADAERTILRRVARTDGLTGLANRTALQEHLAAIEVGPGAATLFVIDLDYLKDLNDRAGHDAGDAMLVEAARRVRAAAGDDCLVARIGGDEFVVLRTGPARRDAAILAALSRAQVQPWAYAGQTHRISFSIGYATFGAGIADAMQLYKAADVALYDAKAAGRGIARAFAPAMLQYDEHRQGLAKAARRALGSGEFEVHFQPVWDLRSHSIIAYEALLRWRRNGELLTPDRFFELFEDPLTQADLQDFVLGAALEAVGRARAGGGEPIVSVNFVASQLQGAASARKILGLIADAGVPASALCVEVTENVMLRRSGGPIVECLEWLREAGVKVALDDFGTGYASLVHLRDLSADVVKIDRSFVARLADDESSRVIVQAVVALASGLGKRVVAEGIETPAQLDVVRVLGCDFGQGFLLGRPAPWDELAPVASAASAKA
jgi:diguanylate cyclase (GGDEF)-like protein